MSKRRGRPKGSVKRSKSTLSETTNSNSNDDELVFIQSGLNYQSEIASQNQIDDQMQSITTEYRQEEPQCFVSEPSGSCVENPSTDTQKGQVKRHQQVILLQQFFIKVILTLVRPYMN